MTVEVVTIEKNELAEMIRDIVAARPAEKSSDVMTLAECAAYFKKSKQSIMNWTNLKEHPLPCGYLGDAPVFYLSEVKQWSKENAERKLKK